MPRLQPLEPQHEQHTDIDDDVEEEIPKDKKNRKTSGPKAQDPYELDDSTAYLYPVLIAVGIFIPTVMCLCKL